MQHCSFVRWRQLKGQVVIILRMALMVLSSLALVVVLLLRLVARVAFIVMVVVSCGRLPPVGLLVWCDVRCRG